MHMLTRAVEIAGEVDAQHHLHLDGPIPPIGPTRVRVIILFPHEAVYPAFDFLSDPAEDIYTLEDGQAIDGPA